MYFLDFPVPFLRFDIILGLTCRVFLPHGSVTHKRALPHLSVVKLNISTP
jgi:hypothetical protein